jgi:hypothetical protein
MGFLKRFFRSHAAVQQLPAGSITVDRSGAIVTSTVASAYPQALLRDIGRDVLHLQFGSLHITARELRGGAIVFLLPQTALLATPNRSRP